MILYPKNNDLNIKEQYESFQMFNELALKKNVFTLTI